MMFDPSGISLFWTPKQFNPLRAEIIVEGQILTLVGVRRGTDGAIVEPTARNSISL